MSALLLTVGVIRAEGTRAEIDIPTLFPDTYQACSQSAQLSACLALRDPKATEACFSRCIETREEAMRAAEEQEKEACESRLVEAGGRGTFACSLTGATPNVDKVRLSREFDAAKRARDGAAIDSVLKRSEGQFLDALQTACTKRCNKWGSDVVAALRQATALVTGYKRCMVAADSTLEARKLDAYEADLYCDYIHRANAQCRAANRCDWLEEHTHSVCIYASPGVDRCQ